jgi:DNA-3-methyladenine glycosylase II
MPFRLDLTAWASRRRSGNTVDVWQDETYRRVLAINDQAVLVEVTQKKTKLDVTITWTESLHRRQAKDHTCTRATFRDST